MDFIEQHALFWSCKNTQLGSLLRTPRPILWRVVNADSMCRTYDITSKYTSELIDCQEIVK